MFVSRRRHEREMQALYGQIRRLYAQRDQAHADAETEREARRIIARHYDDAQTALIRLHGRNQHLTDLLDLAREAQDEAGFARLEGRLHRALRAVARLRSELAAQHRVNDRLSDQLMGTLGYNDAGLRALSAAITTTTKGDQ